MMTKKHPTFCNCKTCWVPSSVALPLYGNGAKGAVSNDEYVEQLEADFEEIIEDLDFVITEKNAAEKEALRLTVKCVRQNKEIDDLRASLTELRDYTEQEATKSESHNYFLMWEFYDKVNEHCLATLEREE